MRCDDIISMDVNQYCTTDVNGSTEAKSAQSQKIIFYLCSVESTVTQYLHVEKEGRTGMRHLADRCDQLTAYSTSRHHGDRRNPALTVTDRNGTEHIAGAGKPSPTEPRDNSTRLDAF